MATSVILRPCRIDKRLDYSFFRLKELFTAFRILAAVNAILNMLIDSCFEFLDTIKSLTKPARLTTWMQHAGFTNVRYQTLVELGRVASVLNAVTTFSLNSDRGEMGLQRGLQSAQNASLELAQGRLVIMLGSVMLAGMMTQGMAAEFHQLGATMHIPRRQLGMLPDLHWMLLKNLTANSSTVTVHLYTYGRSVHNTFDTRHFLEYYNGYVSGQHPLAPAVNIPLLSSGRSLLAAA